ncbi:MAG TPA: hypothetical protein VN709_02135 [Terriglobales bacterium]|nr:hypothetical protein [Terriglobales bacterium]
MILVETSVWIEHLRSADLVLTGLLTTNQVVMHPFVLGELALGQISPRDQLLQDWANLPKLVPATDDEVLELIARQSLFARGIGYIDVHLLAALRLAPGVQLWSYDKRLNLVAGELGVAMNRG